MIDEPADVAGVMYSLNQCEKRGFREVYIVDPHFCNTRILGLALDRISPVVDYVQVVYFANDPDQCLINAENPDREGKEVREFIKVLSKKYNPPKQCIPVYRP